MIKISENRIFIKLFNENGSMLLIAYYVMVILLGLNMAFLLAAINEARVSQIQNKTVKALNIAEAGMERAIYDLRQDCVTDSKTPSWSDGNINGMTIGPDTANYYAISDYNGNSLDGGSYSTQLKNIIGDEKAIWVKTTGTINSINQTIEGFVRMYSVSPWHYAIFGGAGLNSTVLDGDFNARGSIHLLGSDLTSSDLALELGTGYKVGNNHSGIPTALDEKITALPTISYNGETVESLGSTLWVKKGLVGLNGTGKIGEADATGNSYKEKVDGVYVKDGYSGSQGVNNVYSDNGTSNTYPLGDLITFPSLSTAYLSYGSFTAYLLANSLVISDAPSLALLADIKPSSNFSFTDATNGYGSISMDGSGNMTISGKVYVNGGDVKFNTNGGTTITYSGSGVIYATGNIEVNANLLTSGNDSFPTNIIGFMTPNNIIFNRSGSNIIGLFYAEGKIQFLQSANILGSLASNYFDMGTTPPTIYQYPSAVDSVPAGMIGTTSTCYTRVLSWEKVAN